MGVGAVPNWRVDLAKAGTGETLGAGPVDDNGYFNFIANYTNIPQEHTKSRFGRLITLKRPIGVRLAKLLLVKG